KVAAEMRALKAAGRPVCDLTVGDFDPRQFPIPERLATAVEAALRNGETNYPASNGMPALRQAILRFYARELNLQYPLESVLVASGARPVIYGLFRAVCDPGDRVVYPVPSWNNNHYVHLVGAVGVPVPCGPEDRFLPTREAIRGLLPGARLLCLNSPLNPTGTAISRGALAGICDSILAENEARSRSGERPLYLLYDQIYWMLCFGDTVHVTPQEIAPEMARYTLLVDGISKAFAATGLRVGWAVGPADVIARMSALLGHIGAWAPRAEQVATVELLDDADAIRAFHRTFKPAIEARLELLHGGFQAMKARGLAVESIPPMGAIYLTARIHPFGRRTPEGAPLRTNEDVRRYVLEAAGIGIIPFQAFGSREENGWFRLSVGAASPADIEAALPRLADALLALG
ncbi:MAG TPA: aminotransferase class I/II-fold pyridoxal phosphate-dependent enzyme, partial [Thermoanaerobaculia bacterium]|nr:aminotransferase class I/II-fold pyridoxal phosphate-dependent enzyme [Thermoanaerobaculia bacterium]